MHGLFGGMGLVLAVIGAFALLFAGCQWLMVGKSRAEPRSAASLTGYAFIFLVLGAILSSLAQLP